MPAQKGEVVYKAPAKAAPTPDPVRVDTSSGRLRTSAPVQPVKAPTEPPQPALAKVGFQGGINEFNSRVQAAHDTFVQIHGYEPTPGLVLDIARSPVMPSQFSPLLQPTSATQARNTAAAASIAPGQAIVVRHDGFAEAQHPAAQATIADRQVQYQSLQKQHPWVAMGMLPIDGHLASGFWDAVTYAQNHPGAAAPLTVGGESLTQYQRENLVGESLVGSRPGENPGLAGTTATASQLYARQTVGRGVKTVADAQDKLKDLAPQFFTGADGKPLPSTGFVNSDWAKAIGKYQSSALYFRQQTTKLATDNHFGTNTAAFIHAWQAKQAAIKKSPFLAVFLQHQPLAFFDHRTNGASVVALMSGDAKGWDWANLPTLELGGLVHLAGLGVNEVAGTIDQAKVDASFVSAYMKAIAPKNDLAMSAELGWKPGGMTEREARTQAAKVLHEHPSWAKVFDPGATGKESGVFNLAVDLLLGAPKLTGERVFAGDIGAVKSSRFFTGKTSLAYNALVKGRLGEAVASLEGGMGAERLNAVLEEAVKNGDVSLAQYQHHAAELYAHGNTTVGEQIINGPLLRPLRTKDLPTPAKVSGGAKNLRAMLNTIGDQWEKTLLARKQEGATSHAANFVASVRQLTARVSPGGSTRSIFNDERLPEDVYNWARVELKASPETAAAYRDEIIRIRARNDVQGATDFGDKLRSAFMAAHPRAELKANPIDSAGPELESESRTYLSFPTAVESRAKAVNTKLNAFGRMHRQTIVSGSPILGAPIPGGGESLAYKHVAADTTRRVIGGGGIFPVEREARKLVDDYLRENPAAIRDVGVARDSAEMGENRYITGKKPTDPLSFRTGDTELTVKGDKVRRASALKAAGGYLRHNLTSDALKAYQASSKDNLQPLVNMILRSRDWRGVLKVATPDQAEAAAETLFTRYKEIEEAGIAAGRTDPLNEALDVLIKNKGAHADEALGDWIDQHKIDMPVRDGLVERSSWDDVTQWWIGKLMTANKWNRRTLFDHVFYGTTHDLVAHGWTVQDALPVAADLAKRQTIYHMLDFSNMLQGEQNLRWLSYFATKHRLYWSWILKEAARRPGLAAAVNDVANHLDSKGNVNLSMFGRSFQIPAARLFWVNPKEYPQTSPVVQAIAETAKGVVEGHGLQSIPDAFGSLTSTSGNLFTRDDQAEMMGIKLALVSAGVVAPTSSSVTAGMSDSQKKLFQRQVNQYSAFYKAEHGVWPSEQDAVKHSLLHATGQELWRANLFLPVTMNDPETPTAGQKNLVQEYGKISDPVRKRAFLDTHPGVALLFGVSQDPMVYLHNNQLWDKFNAAQKWVEGQRNLIWQGILKNGYTPETKIAMKRVSDLWSAKIEQLKMQDATTWPGSQQFPAGKVSDGRVVTPGPWGTILSGDPLAARAFVHQSFPEIKPSELNAHTVGQRVVALQQEAATLRGAKTPAQIAALGYPDAQHVRERLAEINQTIAPFFSYPKDAPSQAQSAYYTKFVGPYVTARDKMSQQLKLAPQDQQDALRSQFRAWKDQHDHPVVVTVDGRKIKFPSVVQIGWATLPPDQRTLGLAQAMSGDWAHVASYEKTMLGVKTPPHVSEGWAAFYAAVRDYTKNPTNPSLVGQQKNGLARKIDKVYPGFYKDFLFAQQPKIERFKHTSLYQQLPDQKLFYQYVGQPAAELAKAIKQNGNRNYYEKYWRNYVETHIVPWLDGQPDLKKALADYGPDFLNTLPSTG